jgi:multisubunit Na+/H+ antiporter MnhF subunit
MNIKSIVTIMATVSLMGVVMAMVWMFVQAILDPTVDDKVVFDIVGPAFQTIVGGFIGLITGIHIGEKKND